MITRIREVRRARRLTLQEVAERCIPPTTPQTIGRLETGSRTVSVGWLNRIAAALDVEPSDLVTLPDPTHMPVVASLGAEGAREPARPQAALPPRADAGYLAVTVASGIGDYRAGDLLWMARLERDAFSSALNRDVIVPRPERRFLFGRLIGHDGAMLQILPLGTGLRQTVVSAPDWLAVAVKLIRSL